MQILTRARARKGWSLTRAAQETGLSEQQIRNLERIGETRDTLPSQITAMTMVVLLETFPELDLLHFVPGTKLSVRSGLMHS